MKNKTRYLAGTLFLASCISFLVGCGSRNQDTTSPRVTKVPVGDRSSSEIEQLEIGSALEVYEEDRAEIRLTAIAELNAEMALEQRLEGEADIARTETRIAEFNEIQDENTITWSEAASYVGEHATVCGPVISARYVPSSKGAPTFINVGADYPDENRFTVVIWGNDRELFGPSPESDYLGETICVTGAIILFDRIVEIEVSDPSQIAR